MAQASGKLLGASGKLLGIFWKLLLGASGQPLALTQMTEDEIFFGTACCQEHFCDDDKMRQNEGFSTQSGAQKPRKLLEASGKLLGIFWKLLLGASGQPLALTQALSLA